VQLLANQTETLLFQVFVYTGKEMLNLVPAIVFDELLGRHEPLDNEAKGDVDTHRLGLLRNCKAAPLKRQSWTSPSLKYDAILGTCCLAHRRNNHAEAWQASKCTRMLMFSQSVA
jgi:hypothetical protein